MKKTGRVSFHNRFDIEVRNKNTGELKCTAQAENIILDQMYNRICNVDLYFDSIHFGTGTGVPIPGRTTLFSHLGTKVATTEEVIKAFPVSKITRYVRIEPSEYVGQTITEVGIAFSSANTSLVTHAMLKDAEGNALTIEKTNTDVIVIYATIFVTLSSSEHLVFSNLPDGNRLLTRLLHGGIGLSEGGVSKVLQVGCSSGVSDSNKNSCYCMATGKTMTRVADVANKKMIWSTRLEVNEANHSIQELGLRQILRVLLGNTPTWNDYQVSNIPLSLIEGETNRFAIVHPRIQDLSLRVDGELTSNYLLDVKHTMDYPYISLADVCENLVGSGENYAEISSFDKPFYNCTETRIKVGGKSIYASGYATMDVIPEYRDLLIGAVLETEIFGGGAGGPETWTKISVSYDGVSFSEVGMAVADSSTGTVLCQSSVLTEAPMKIQLEYNGNSDTNYGQPNWARVALPLPAVVEVLDEITEENLVTASYTVTSVPKSGDYVLDVTFEVIFGEAV